MTTVKTMQNNQEKLIGPSKTPQDFGFGSNDSHLVVNDANETVKVYDSKGVLLAELPALARGQFGDTTYNIPKSDTPPGLYKIGTTYPLSFSEKQPWHARKAFGWCTFDLEELEDQERSVGRAGICLHGGGSACKDPWAPKQKLYPTHGCIRMHNQDLHEIIYPLVKKGTVYVSVYQEAA